MVIFGNKRGQVAIFVIVGLVIAAGIITYLIVSGSFGAGNMNPDYQEVFTRYSECVSLETEHAIDIAESQGGRIDVGQYIPGSDYAPFSNYLNFMNFPVPYWYYISGNGIAKQNVPTKAEIQNQIADYVEANIGNCNFDDIYAKGYYINFSTAQARVTINDNSVDVTMNSRVMVYDNSSSATKSSYDVRVDSKLGKFYDIAREIYDYEMSDSFLENYSVDVLRNYAPVDGVEITCSPKVWQNQQIVDDLLGGLEGNIAAIKLDGNYYSLNSDKDEYFVVPVQTDEAVNFIYSKDWPTKVEINGDGVGQAVSIATPVGNQAGMGVMGFCYVPYHFVYDISYPVLVQIYDGDEVFQFPVVVVVDKNLPRQQLYSSVEVDNSFDLCQYYTKDVEINTFDVHLNKVNANLSYNCFDQECPLGESKDGIFKGKAPACVNGNIVAESGGYSRTTKLFSSNTESSTDIVLDRMYLTNVKVLSAGNQISNSSNIFVSFTKENGETVFANIPEINQVDLSEGQYDIKVYVFSNSSITIPKSSTRQCTEVPDSGILGFFGSTEEKCYTVDLPETKLDYALIGGGVGSEYFTDSKLSEGEVTINIGTLNRPRTIEDLQNNYQSFDTEKVYVQY